MSSEDIVDQQYMEESNSDDEKLQSGQDQEARLLAQGAHKDQQAVLPSEDLGDLLDLSDGKGEPAPPAPDRTDVRLKDMTMATPKPLPKVSFSMLREFTPRDAAAMNVEASFMKYRN